jgi:hypothetical protein
MGTRILIGFLVVFVATQVFEGFVNLYLLFPITSQLSYIWRPVVEAKLWMLPFTGMFFSFFFTYVFSKGYENKGIAEGIRYGAIVAMMVALPHAYGTYALMQIPYAVALQWFIYGAIEYVLAGILLAIVFKKRSDQPATS